MSETTRFNVALHEEHAAKLHSLAARTSLQPGSIARSLLSAALDDPESQAVAALLDSIPGAYESAIDGRRALREGRLVRFEDL
jgi:hypothetical protein